MPFNKPKKGEKGESALYMTRNKALEYLQIGLEDFCKLTIWKGIYPREPKHRRKAQRGCDGIKILYLKEDMKFLNADPMIWVIRQEKIHRRKVRSLSKTDKKKGVFQKEFRKPQFTLDHMVLERYPTFGHALEDMSDCLNALFIYATMPNIRDVNQNMVFLARKLTLEFMAFIIEARCLRKAFISFKGYYYRAHIQGHKVTWIIPHQFSPPLDSVRVRQFGTFIQFYITMLSFINYKVYTFLNLHYPPNVNFKKEKKSNEGSDRYFYLKSLNTKLESTFKDDDMEEDNDYDCQLLGIRGPAQKLFRKEQKKKVNQQKLFENTKFFLGRETNRESLTFIIRAAGGEVSWDRSLGSGATYPVEDEEIKYQIVDRPTCNLDNITRYYVQPQWVYDSFNGGILLPVQDYFVGVELPAHLSPFEETFKDSYAPPEQVQLHALQGRVNIVGEKKKHDIDLEFSSSEDEEQNDSEMRKVDEEIEEEVEKPAIEKNAPQDAVDPLAGMKVSRSSVQRKRKVNHVLEDIKLREKFIHKKQKSLYKKVRAFEQRGLQKNITLKKRRVMYEKDQLAQRKKTLKDSAKKAQKAQTKLLMQAE